MFDMTDNEYQTLLGEFDVILKQINLLGEISHIDEYAPMDFPYELFSTYLREDVPSEPLDKNEALKNASDVKDGQIKLPKVVG